MFLTSSWNFKKQKEEYAQTWHMLADYCQEKYYSSKFY